MRARLVNVYDVALWREKDVTWRAVAQTLKQKYTTCDDRLSHPGDDDGGLNSARCLSASARAANSRPSASAWASPCTASIAGRSASMSARNLCVTCVQGDECNNGLWHTSSPVPCLPKCERIWRDKVAALCQQRRASTLDTKVLLSSRLPPVSWCRRYRPTDAQSQSPCNPCKQEQRGNHTSGSKTPQLPTPTSQPPCPYPRVLPHEYL